MRLHHAKKLVTITLKHSFNNIYENAFTMCSGITSVQLGETSLTTISTNCFSNCTNLVQLTLPPSIAIINERAFSFCKSLKSITFPSSLTKIGIYAFEESGLEKATFTSDSLMTHIHTRSFSGCRNLTEFEYPDKLEVIENYAFADCGFVSIILPNSVKELLMNCFSSNINLINFTIQKDSLLEVIESGVFEKDYSLEFIKCYGDNFIVETSALLNKERTRVISFPPASKTKYLQIPQSVKQIGDYAFSNCVNLISVSIPDDSLEEICLRAFMNCNQLRFINLPSSITSIGKEVFKGCKSLSCGIPVDVTPSLRNVLIKDALFPINALLACKKRCFTYAKKYTYSSYAALTAILTLIYE